MNQEKITSMFISLSPDKDMIRFYSNLTMEIWDMFKGRYEKVDEAHNHNHIYHVLTRSIDIVEFCISKHLIKKEDRERFYKQMIFASILHDSFSYTHRKMHHEKAYELAKVFESVKVNEQNQIDVVTKAENDFNLKLDILRKLDVPEELRQDISHFNFNWLKFYNKIDVNIVAYMVLQHRASNKDDFINLQAEIFSCADRDDLDLSVIVNRIYKCACDDGCLFDFEINGHIPLDIVINNVSYHSSEIITYLKDSLEWDSKQIKTFYHLWEKFSRVGYMFKKLKPTGVYFEYYKDVIEEFYKEVDDIIVNPEKMLTYLKV